LSSMSEQPNTESPNIEQPTYTTLRKNNSNEGKVTIKNSSYNKMLEGIVVAITVSAFLGGYLLGTTDSSSSDISIEILEEILEKLDERSALVPLPAGGHMIPIDTTAVLLAWTQMNAYWLIPVILAAVGIGIVISRKFLKKERVE